MEAPSHLSPEAAELWTKFHEQCVKQGTWQDTDAEVLSVMVQKILLARSSRAAAEVEPFVAGSKGQLVAHPGLKLAREAEADVLAFAKALLLTPETRRRHGIEVHEGEDELDALLG